MKIADIIKYEGDNSTFIWKHPCEDFNSFTQLIVHESQEAILFMNGQALDLFGPGRHTLTTQNIPLLGKLINKTTDGESPFHCEVYFINKTEQMAIKWGTDSKVQFMEPTYNFPLEIGACGDMSLKADDSRKLLLKLVGTESVLDRSSIVSYFRAFLMTKVKSYLAAIIKNKKINIFEIDAQLSEMSADLLNALTPDFADYGVSLEKFLITTIIKPDGDENFERYKRIHFSRVLDIEEAKVKGNVTLIESQILAQKRQQEGYTYQQERAFDVAQGFAENEGGSQMANLGAGLGAMMGVGGAVGGMIGNVFGATVDMTNSSVSGTVCRKCGASVGNSKFCPECGEKVATQSNKCCPDCGAAVGNSKFCPECGKKLNTICKNCSAETNGAKFCPECGTKQEV